jgi:GNAT superfamily N-acetyltransferase
MEAVRVARATDAERIAELVDEFAREMAPRRGASLLNGPGGLGPGRIDGPEALAVASGDADRLALVATLDDVVVGIALCHLEDAGATGRRGVIDTCYVEPGARVVGLGRMLMDRALGWCADQQCRGIDGFAFPGDRGAKSFFESAGFKARLLVMHRDLD